MSDLSGLRDAAKRFLASLDHPGAASKAAGDELLQRLIAERIAEPIERELKACDAMGTFAFRGALLAQAADAIGRDVGGAVDRVVEVYANRQHAGTEPRVLHGIATGLMDENAG